MANAPQIPRHWHNTRLRQVCLQTELTDPGRNPAQRFIYVDVSSVSNNSFAIEETKELLGQDAPSRARKLIRTDDIIFATVRPTLRRIALVPAWLDGQICSTGYCVIRPDPQRLLPAYVYYYLLTVEVAERVQAMQKGATYPAINDNDLLGLSIPLPPLPEQRAIANVLRAVQAAREARQREVALERERKAALMAQLFTHGTRGEPMKQTPIGEMPVSWEVAKFSDAVDVTEGQVNPLNEPYRSMVHVGPENIESGTGRLINLKTNAEVNIISGNYLFTSDDILYSKIRPYLNKVALPACDGTCSADMYPLRPKAGQLDKRFLCHFLLSQPFVGQAISFQDRTGIPKINRVQLGSILLVKPSLPEQESIAEVLTACDAKIAALERESALLDELFRALLEELMTGWVAVAGVAGDGELPLRLSRPPTDHVSGELLLG